MKRFLAVVSIVLLMLSVAMAANSTLVATWNQVMAPDLAGWEIYVSDQAGGPYNMGQQYLRDADGNPLDFVAVPYDGNQLNEYTTQAFIEVPDEAQTTLYFVCIARDTGGTPSGNSNEASVTVDFDTAPSAPITFTITVQTP